MNEPSWNHTIHGMITCMQFYAYGQYNRSVCGIYIKVFGINLGNWTVPEIEFHTLSKSTDHLVDRKLRCHTQHILPDPPSMDLRGVSE